MSAADVLTFLGVLALAVVLGMRLGLVWARAERDLDRHIGEALSLADGDRAAARRDGAVCDAADMAETADERRWPL